LEFEKGLYVAEVKKGGPAEAAGIKEEDIIIAVAGKEINSFLELREALEKSKPGEIVDIDLLRKGKRIVVAVVLGEMPA